MQRPRLNLGIFIDEQWVTSVESLLKGATSHESLRTIVLSDIGVREGILLGGRKKFALKLTICPKNRQLALKLTF